MNRHPKRECGLRFVWALADVLGRCSMIAMPEDQPVPQNTVTLDQSRMDALYCNLQTSFRNWISELSKALDKATDLNKQVFLFYERILLIDTGTLGVSVSVTLSSTGHLSELGHIKVAVVITVILGWMFLLFSILYCRLAITYSMNANRDLFHHWRNESDKLNSLVMGSDIQRIASTFKGNLVVEGKEVDIAEMIKDLGGQMKTKIAEVVATREAEEGKADLSDSQRHGRWAISCMQIGLILLGIAAVTVLIKL